MMRMLLPLVALACTPQESAVAEFAGEVRTSPQAYSQYVGDIGGFQLALHRPELWVFYGQLKNQQPAARCGIEVRIDLESGEERRVEVDRLESGETVDLSFEPLSRGDGWQASIVSYHCVHAGPRRTMLPVQPWGAWSDIPGVHEFHDDDLDLVTRHFSGEFHALFTHRRSTRTRGQVGLQLTDGETTIQLGPSMPLDLSATGQGTVVFESDRLEPEQFQAIVAAP